MATKNKHEDNFEGKERCFVLTRTQFKQIRKLWKTGKYRQAELAAQFGTHTCLISKIINYKVESCVE